MLIRPEGPADIGKIRALTESAFAAVPQSRQTEAAIIDELRAAGALTLSLVAVADDGQILGHIAVSPVTIHPDAGAGWYGGGPLSVRPDHQRSGVGTALIHAAIRAMRERGARGCVLVGDPTYYARFGFINTGPLVVPAVSPENVLVLVLDGAVPSGTAAFHPAFAAEPNPAGN